MINAQAADGSTHTFPDNTNPAVIDRVMKSYATTGTPTANDVPPLPPGFTLDMPITGPALLAQLNRPGADSAGKQPPTAPASDRLGLLLEAERRGILPADQQSLLHEARNRGIIPLPPLPSGFTLDGAPPAEPPNTLVQFGHGMDRQVGGTRQLAKIAVGDPADRDAYTAQLNDEEARYQAGMEAGRKQQRENPTVLQQIGAIARSSYGPEHLLLGQLGTNYESDLPSTLGSAAMLAPLMMFGGGSSVLARALANAVQGGVVGATTPSESGTAWDKIKQTAFGTTIGAGLSAAGDTVAPVASWVKNKLVGAPIDKLPADVAARLAASVDTGVNLDKAQLTGNPNDWYARQAMAEKEGPTKAAFAASGQQQREQLAAALTKVKANPAAETTGYQAGQAALDALHEWSTTAQQGVGGLYTTARNAVGSGTEVPLQPIADQLGKTVENYGVENIPPAVVSRLKAYGMLDGTQTRSMTVTDAEQFRRFLGNNTDWKNPTQAKAVSSLQNAVDEATGSLADTAGGDAAQAFQTARAAARARFQEQEASSITSGLLKADEVSPEFIQRKIVNGKPGDISTFLGTLGKQNPEAASGIHDATIDWMGQQKSVTDAAKKLGPDRMAAVFSPDEIQKLNNIQTVEQATKVPANAGINGSKTGSRLLNALKSGADKMGGAAAGVAGEVIGQHLGVPVVGGIVGGGGALLGQALAERAAQKRMQSMLTPQMSDLVGTTASQQQRQALAAALAKLAPPATTLLSTRATAP